jgi:hypothetical protein
MNLVVDASVALKCFFRAREGEADVEPAIALLAGIVTDRFRLWQPPHFLAEVAAAGSAQAGLESKCLRWYDFHTFDLAR